MVATDPLRIALVAPLYESIPPALYGGTERVVANLAKELTQQGHLVTTYGSGDSRVAGTLVPVCERSLRLSQSVDSIAHHVLQNEMVFRDAVQYDVIHFHNGYLHMSGARRCKTPSVTTFHGRLDLPDLKGLGAEFSDLPVVSISIAQRKPLSRMNWVDTVYNGIDASAFSVQECTGDYLLFLGRISPEKRPDRAIEIATRAGYRLIIAAKVDDVDRQYFESRIKPLLSQPGVEFIGEVNEDEKGMLLCGAAGLLFPIDWPEPFGLVMIEAMACGTPVLAFKHGSVPEVMQDGISGFVVESVDDAVEAVKRLLQLDRFAVRTYFETRFTAECMAKGYLRVYRQLIERDPGGATRVSHRAIQTA